jgi:ribosomal protein L37AE/L43A
MSTFSNILATEKWQKVANEFYCNFCDYKCSKKYNWLKHLNTLKHKESTTDNTLVAKEQLTSYKCENCSKEYSERTGLWRHKKKCEYTEKTELDKDELIITLLKQNAELIKGQQDMIVKLSENGINNTNANHSYNTTNSHNKAFNLNFFLNETCKEAMNIGEFVESIKIQMSDLEKVGEVGYIEGISNIIVKNLKELDITKRPVHCTDKKRETVYIKDNNIWEKDEDKSKMHKLIKKVVYKNANMFSKFREVHPDCTKYHSKFSDQYNKIIYESMGGKGDNEDEKNEKIIKNVLKQVVVDKNI